MKQVLVLLTLLLIALPAHGQTRDELLRRAGAQTEKFVDNFSLVRSTEQMVQLKMDAKGKVALKQTADYDYVGIVHVSNGTAKVEESRVNKSVPAQNPAESQLVTSGFATLVLIFHPEFQGSFTFQDAPGESQSGSRALTFELKPSGRSTTVFRFRDRNFPVEWKGIAWLDRVSGAVLRIHAEMRNPIGDLGLQLLEADVEYAPIQFQDVPETYWLPRIATVDLETNHQHWKNTHTFRNYAPYTVSTSASVVH